MKNSRIPKILYEYQSKGKRDLRCPWMRWIYNSTAVPSMRILCCDTNICSVIVWFPIYCYDVMT